MEDIIGKQLGTFHVLKQLGRGGMATVYLAHQTSVDRDVALKVLPHHLGDDARFVKRFEREARLLAQLQHAHILPIYDYGESDGYTYIAMPLIRGGTLAKQLTGQPWELAEAEKIIQQLASALDYAHSKGVVHRDIKPSNVLLDESGGCLLSDFGIAKLYADKAQLTHAGTIIGTPTYMSPEQGRGQPLDKRSDIYSLGIILYELITGHVPFDAETPIAVVYQQINDPPPPPQIHNSLLPPGVETIIEKALTKEPDDRFQSAGELSEALHRFLKDPKATDDVTLINEKPAYLPVRTDGQQLPYDMRNEVTLKNDVPESRDTRKNRLVLGVIVLLIIGILALALAFIVPYIESGSSIPTPVPISSESPNINDGTGDIHVTMTTTTEPNSVDSDNDGLSDAVETILGTLPQKQDTDDDGLSDLDEVRLFGTNPLKSDTDGDTILDIQELGKECLDPTTPDTDGDGTLDNNELDPCAESTPTPTASHTPSPNPSATQMPKPTATVTPTSTKTPTATVAPSATIAPSPSPIPTVASTSTIPTVASTPTSMSVTVTAEPGVTVGDEPSSTPTVHGDLFFTTLNRIYSIDTNGQNPTDHGEARQNTCQAQAQTALGETFGLYYGPYCGIGETGTGSCRSPNQEYEVITNAVSLTESSIVVRPAGIDSPSFVFQGKVDRSEGIRWAPTSDKFLFVTGDTVYAASLDGSYSEIIPTAYGPQFSPSGNLILYTKPVGPGIVDIFVSNADGTHSRNVTNASFDHIPSPCPRWSGS